MKNKKKYTGITLALSLALGFLLTTTAEARRLTLTVDRRYSSGNVIELKRMANRQYNRSVLRGRKLIAIEVKGNSTRSTRARLSLVVDGDQESSERLRRSRERIIMRNHGRSNGSWELEIDRAPAYIEEIVLIVGNRNGNGNGNRDPRCGRACQRACDLHTSTYRLERLCKEIGSRPKVTKGCKRFTSTPSLEGVCLSRRVNPGHAKRCYRNTRTQRAERRCLERF